ncbi:MAG: hypothetical protein HY962_06740 [Ignavibacteriae bacterium]|nr:hypothetical protein [Ignavibacteriota bacterium]
MYALYNKTGENGSIQYRFQEGISLFGCNKGYIPWLLANQLTAELSEPLSWHVNIENSLKAVGQDNQTLVIDLKPNSKLPNLSLYEVLDVWGYSGSGWTPILFHHGGLFIDEDPIRFDKNNFVRWSAEVDTPIFSMMYLRGTVKDGRLNGKWTPPVPSPTNSVLLWPGAFEFFCQQAKRIIENAA